MPATCPECGETGLEGRYCDRCGARLERACPSCAAPNRLSAGFCAECGTRLEPAESGDAELLASAPEQKHVTVLFADICGSTALISGMESEEASETLNTVVRVISEAVARCGGLVNMRMGDGVMALFGAPVAIEDHAARACFAALALLEDLAALGPGTPPVRVGIASGPVILRRIGRDRGDYEASGLTAHIAARLEQQAEPGTALLSSQTASLVRGIAQLAPLGDRMLKGLQGRVPVFRLLGASDRPSWAVRSSIRALSPFVGRAAELAALREVLAEAREGRTRAVALVGDAGMGKSRLAHEVLSGLPPGDWHVLRVEATTQSAAVPVFLVPALLRAFAGCAQDDTETELAARLPSAAAAFGPDLAAELLPLLAQAEQVDRLERMQPAERRRRIVDALHDLLRRCAGRQPTLLLVEDYHWLDGSSAEILQALLDRLDGARLAVLVTARPDRVPGWPRWTAGADGGSDRGELVLPRLSAEEADRLLRELIGADEALRPLRKRIAAHADGTPFFLEEFTRSLRETGGLANGAADSERIEVPHSIQAILASRIDRIPPAHRRVLQIAAVVGRDVPMASLSAIAGMPAQALSQAVGSLRAAHFLVESGTAAEGTNSFAHALVQAVAYDTLLRSERRAIHARVLRALEAQPHGAPIEMLAHHATLAEAWPEAARYALEAGDWAARRSAWTEAHRYLQVGLNALKQQPATPESVQLGIDARLRLRNVLYLANRSAAGQSALDEAAGLAETTGDRATLARVFIVRSAALSHAGDLAQSTRLGRLALDIMQECGDAVGVVSAAFALCQALWYSGDFAAGRAVLDANVGLARGDGARVRSAATFVLPAVVFFCYRAQFCSDLGDDATAAEALAEARVIADAHGRAFDRLLVDVYEGAQCLATGQQEAAVAVLEHALRVARANEIEYHLPAIAAALGRAYVDLGRVPEARSLLQAGVASAEREQRVGKRLICIAPLVRALASGPDADPAAARELAVESLAEAAALGFRPTVVRLRLAHAFALAGLGREADAEVERQEAEALARRLGLAPALRDAAQMAAAWPQRDPPTGAWPPRAEGDISLA